MAFRTILIGAAALAVAGGAVFAQSPFPPVGQEAPSAQQNPPCLDQFLQLRGEVDKRFNVVKTALEKRSSASELCRLLTRFTESEIKMIKYVEENGAWCGFPPNALPSMKASHNQSMDYRKQACTAASTPRPRPVEPSLSDLLSPPVASKDTTRTGRGTLDSLGGNPIGR